MRVNWQNVIEQALGGIVTWVVIGVVGWAVSLAISKPGTSRWVGLLTIVVALIVVLALLAPPVRQLFGRFGAQIIRHRRRLLVAVAFGVIWLSVFLISGDLRTVILLVAYTMFVVLTFIMWPLTGRRRAHQRRIRQFSGAEDDAEGTQISLRHNSEQAATIPEWQRRSISQWAERLPDFEPVPLDEGTRSSNHYNTYEVLGLKPLLGREGVPFVLRVDENHEWIRGIEVWSRTPTDKDVSPEITPGAQNVLSAYVLITAGNAWRINQGVSWEGKKIGYLRFRFTTLEQDVELILGRNIREWSYRETRDVGVVDTLSDPSMEQVWRSDDDRSTLDMLRVDLVAPFPLSRDDTILYCQIVAECEGLPPDYPVDELPHIRVSGLTYRVQRPG